MSKSYFEISGHIVECSTDGNTSHPSSKSAVSAAERPERGRISAKTEWGVTPEKTAKDSLFTHWMKTVSYPARSAADVVMDKPETVLGVIKDPRTIGAFGIQWYLDTIEMNYDYFVKGESSPW